jgi:hypothetical protein
MNDSWPKPPNKLLKVGKREADIMKRLDEEKDLKGSFKSSMKSMKREIVTRAGAGMSSGSKR